MVTHEITQNKGRCSKKSLIIDLQWCGGSGRGIPNPALITPTNSSLEQLLGQTPPLRKPLTPLAAPPTEMPGPRLPAVQDLLQRCTCFGVLSPVSLRVPWGVLLCIGLFITSGFFKNSAWFALLLQWQRNPATGDQTSNSKNLTFIWAWTHWQWKTRLLILHT